MKAKVKLSISLADDLLQEIDREARLRAASRSRIIEIWLQLASRRRAAQELEQDTIAYYKERTAATREDDESWGRAAALAAKQLRIDDDRPRARPSRSR